MGFLESQILFTFALCLNLKHIINFIKAIWLSDVVGDVFLQVVL